MEERISLEAIALYSDKYAAKLADGIFSSREVVSTEELLAISPVQQVNLFVVGGLFRLWKEEVKKLKSPYFDYSHPDVQQALQQLMNVLSRHISINREHLLPLLKKAASTTLLVVFSPYDYYSSVITGSKNVLNRTAFREELKYLKVNREPLERLLNKLDNDKIEEISGNQAFAMLDSILEEVSFTPADVEPFIEQFSKTEKLNPENFYIKIKSGSPVKKEKQQQAAKVQPAGEPKARPTVADNFRKVERLRDTLTINQKFMFTKVLFNGDFELFSQTIDELDRQTTLNDALKHLESHMNAWNPESDEYQEFMEVLEQRFS